MTLLFCLSIFHPLAFLVGTLCTSRTKMRFSIVPCVVGSIFTVLHRIISSGPSFCWASPEHFQHQIKASPFRSTLLAMSCPPKCDLRLSQLVFGIFSQPPWSFTLPLYLHIFAASSASRTPTLVCLFTKVHFSFGFGFSSSQSFHSLHQTVHIANLHKLHLFLLGPKTL